MDEATFQRHMEDTIGLMRSHLEKIEEALDKNNYPELTRLWTQHRNASHHAMLGSVDAVKTKSAEN